MGLDGPRLASCSRGLEAGSQFCVPISLSSSRNLWSAHHQRHRMGIANETVEPNEQVVQRYLQQLEAGISDPTGALSPTRSTSPAADVAFSPTPGYYGRPGARLPTAEESLRIYRQQGWIPAVAGPFEADRLRVLERYNLSRSVEAHASIDRVTDLASTIFQVPIVVVSLVMESEELFVSTLGWDKVSSVYSRIYSTFMRVSGTPQRSRSCLLASFTRVELSPNFSPKTGEGATIDGVLEQGVPALVRCLVLELIPPESW